jgi:biopolymer transport protein ExbB
VIDKLAARKFGLVRELCAGSENVISKVVLAAIDRVEKNPASAREAVELTAKNEVTKLWEALSYLSDIAVIAPLVGLLGTVLGMIDAFNAIAFQTAAVKPVLLAGGIAKAMVTTAAGLIIAIPASIFYSFFRSRVSKITATVEALASEITDILADSEARAVSKR